MELSKALLILKHSSVSLVYIYLVSSVLPGANVYFFKPGNTFVCVYFFLFSLCCFYQLYYLDVLYRLKKIWRDSQSHSESQSETINQTINLWLVYPVSIIYSELELKNRNELTAHYFSLAGQLMHIFGMHSDHFHRNTTIKLGLFPLLFPGPTWVASALLCTKSDKH